MPLEFVEISDINDNVQYPHTSSEVVFFSDSSVENLVNKNTFFEFMIRDNKYSPKEYDVPGYIRGGEIWFTGEYITQQHYLGSRISVGNKKSFKLNMLLEDEEIVHDSKVAIICIDSNGDTLSISEPTPTNNSRLISATINIPDNTLFLLVGINGNVSTHPVRVAHSFSVIDANSNSKTLEGYRTDVRDGTEVVGKSKLLNTDGQDIKLVVSNQEPDPIDNTTIVWIEV